MGTIYDTVKTASRMTDGILVGVSGGKDSAAALDLCFRYFKKVQPYFMYVVRGLSFQEAALKYYEQRYNTEIMRIPHFMLSDFFRYGTYRPMDFNVPIVKTVEAYNYLREQSGIYWIACGERIADSMVRRAMIKESGTIDDKRGRIYPIAEWTKADVLAYNKQHRIPLSLESRVLGHSFRSLMPSEVARIKESFPNDYEKIREWFPLVGAAMKWEEYYAQQV